MTPPTRYNVRQAAKLIGKSPSWLYQQGAAGNIPRCKLGHSVWWTEAQIDEILRSAEQPAKQAKQPEKQPNEQKAANPAPAKKQQRSKTKPAPVASNAKIPQADFSVSRLYRSGGAA